MAQVEPLLINSERCRYRALIGTGGIGSGSFFALQGNDTLGREESRSGRFIDRRDYCKLHIVSHYVQALLGSGFKTIPIGRVGDDGQGLELYDEMKEAGLDVTFVEKLPGAQTLFSFCFIYPDGTGGNLTTDNSASSSMTAQVVEQAETLFTKYEKRGIGLAVPEVPLEARLRLLELAGRHSFFRIASFTAGELREMGESHIFNDIDLLSLNLEELAQVAALDIGRAGEERVVREGVEALGSLHPKLWITVTAGGRGSWSWDGTELTFFPAVAAEVKSTAGAGDAFLAGVIVGLTAGLTLGESQQLGTLVGSLSVTSPHTIHRGIDRVSLRQFIVRGSVKVSPAVQALFGG
jgi:sugar/nucleoside kinase (ribokinase family)